MKKKKKKNNKKNKNKKKRAPDPPGYLRPNSFVPRAPKGTHAGEGSLASEKVSLPITSDCANPNCIDSSCLKSTQKQNLAPTTKASTGNRRTYLKEITALLPPPKRASVG